MSLKRSSFEIDAADRGEAHVVRLKGELDMDGCPTLEIALEEAERSQADEIFLDLEELTFMDARGLHTILKAIQRSSSNGNRFQITRGNGQVARIFRLTELDKELPFIDASGSAIRGVIPMALGGRAAPASREIAADRTG